MALVKEPMKKRHTTKPAYTIDDRNFPIDQNTAMTLAKNPGKKRRTTKPAYTIGDKTVTLKRPGGAVVAHAWAQGGSHHKPMRSQPLGCHPKEFKTKWTTKKGMGTPIA